ncbi:M28 family peptidase [Xylophilus sp. GOD-11R]|uniref:M28 family peptidase n=1 Tax=Xylophilus sp. GOD-11R TaxID=3089814 RepID=UPI00298D409A|nr:M28 family peptidase [Xylophilus sp. GOD-11R]WPB55725.1 M28 family peptidase [Xylophilus sp. GOD-11R]
MKNDKRDIWLDAAEHDPALMADFGALCAFGGRLAGTPEEAAAMAWAIARMAEIGGEVRRVEVPYDGWRCLSASLALEGGATLACKPLLRSASTPAEGLSGEVIDLGAGRTEDFDRVGDAVRGRIVLVRHEYPFSPRHMHRRRKYDLAVARGAAGFLIANPLPGRGLLSGSSGRAVDGAGIPAAYIDDASCQALVAAGPHARVRLFVAGEELRGSQAGIGVLDLPGGSGRSIVISAHMDGHDLGQSALDNATGVAVALAAARALAPRIGAGTHGLRVCLFSAEEWALAGSAQYLAAMEPAERDRLALDINLDTVAGDERLTALISDFPGLAPFVAGAAAASGVPVDSYLPLMPNSDHANFARHDIPALRLVAGFDREDSRVNHILGGGDVPAVVEETELRRALRVTCAMADAALAMSDEALAGLRR